GAAVRCGRCGWGPRCAARTPAPAIHREVSMADCGLTEDRGPVRVIALNRPSKRNAIDLELRVELGGAGEAAMADPGVRVVVLTGAGGTFCSGGDISTMRRMPRA